MLFSFSTRGTKNYFSISLYRFTLQYLNQLSIRNNNTDSHVENKYNTVSPATTLQYNFPFLIVDDQHFAY